MPQPSTPTAFDAPSAALPESMQRTWSIHSLTVLERFLRQAVLSLFAASTSKQMYAWLPHVWLPLCGRRRELLFQHRLRRTGSRIECIVGSNYQLDQMLSEEWPDDVYRVRLGTQNSFSEQRQFHFHLIDDYVLLAQSDTETAARIDTLFQKYPYPEDIPPAAVRELVQAKASITLTLLKDSGEARALRRRFETLLRKTA